MENHKRILIALVLVIGVSFFGACSHMGKGLKPLESQEVRLELKSDEGWVEDSEYYSHSISEFFQDQQKTRHKEDMVEFTVRSEALPVDPKAELVHYRLTTIKKDGVVNLHGLAFPEKDEVLEMVYTPQARVVKAGKFPKNSIFYVPPLSLPSGPVRPGDTWTLEAEWIGMENGLPLKMQLVTVFRDLYPCGKGGKCADLDVSGDVSVMGLNQDLLSQAQQLRFESTINGRVVFSLTKGTVLWSLVRSEEGFTSSGGHVAVKSCIASRLVKPASEMWFKSKGLVCNPNSQEVVVPLISQ